MLMTMVNVLGSRKCDCHVQVPTAQVELAREQLEQRRRWRVLKCKGQAYTSADSEKMRTRRMLKPDLAKWSIASGNLGLQGKVSQEAKTGDLPDLRKLRRTIKTRKNIVTNKELSN